MTEWIKYGHVLACVLLAALILTLVWSLWPVIMSLLGLFGAYFLVATVLRVRKLDSETSIQSKEKRR